MIVDYAAYPIINLAQYIVDVRTNRKISSFNKTKKRNKYKIAFAFPLGGESIKNVICLCKERSKNKQQSVAMRKKMINR